MFLRNTRITFDRLPTAMQSTILGFFKSLLVFVLMVFLAIALVAMQKSQPKHRIKLLKFINLLFLKVANVRIEMEGRVCEEEPVLYVSNHSSYLDIIILGHLIGKSFVAKNEVKGWPLLGTVAKYAGTVFVERDEGKVLEGIKKARGVFEKNGALILFAEGTTSNGKRVLPFKSSFFAMVEGNVSGKAVRIQPISITYTRVNNIPMSMHLRPFFAWYGDMELIPHLWQMLKFQSVTAEVAFMPLVSASDFKSRKEISEFCHKKIANSVASSLTGRKEELMSGELAA